MSDKENSKTDELLKTKPYLFQKGFDPRRNTAGRPKSGESLAEHVRDLLDTPMKRTGSEEETTILDAGLMELAKAFARGDPDIVKLMLDRGFGKVAESIILSRFDQEEDDNLDALPMEALELMLYFEWVADGSPEPELAIKDTKLQQYAAIEQAITDSRILQRIKKLSTYQSSPSLTDGEKTEGESND